MIKLNRINLDSANPWHLRLVHPRYKPIIALSGKPLNIDKDCFGISSARMEWQQELSRCKPEAHHYETMPSHNTPNIPLTKWYIIHYAVIPEREQHGYAMIEGFMTSGFIVVNSRLHQYLYCQITFPECNPLKFYVVEAYPDITPFLSFKFTSQLYKNKP